MPLCGIRPPGGYARGVSTEEWRLVCLVGAHLFLILQEPPPMAEDLPTDPDRVRAPHWQVDCVECVEGPLAKQLP